MGKLFAVLAVAALLAGQTAQPRTLRDPAVQAAGPTGVI